MAEPVSSQSPLMKTRMPTLWSRFQERPLHAAWLSRRRPCRQMSETPDVRFLLLASSISYGVRRFDWGTSSNWTRRIARNSRNSAIVAV